jgi:linoleoyl-CoA desaturase
MQVLQGHHFNVGIHACYIHLVFLHPQRFGPPGMCIIGWYRFFIGFNVMRDGAHGSFSKNKGVNCLAAFSLNILGGNSFMWNVSIVIHRTYTMWMEWMMISISSHGCA